MTSPLPDRIRWSAYLAMQMVGQRRFPFRPAHVIRAAQQRNLSATVRHAYLTVPYYRETMRRLGLTPSDITQADDLGKLPVLERELVQRDPEYLLSESMAGRRLRSARSSGSAGEPLTVFWDWPASFRSAAHGERFRTILTAAIGRRFGYRETLIAVPGGSTSQGAEFNQSAAWLPRWLRVDRQEIDLTEPLAEVATRVNRFKPDVLRANGSYVDGLVTHLRAKGAPFHRPRAIVFGGDGLSDACRRIVTDDLGIPVFGLYQSIEAPRMGFECEQHSGLHLNVDLYPLRIVDPEGRPLPLEAPGEVLVSNLVNRATVLLNYRQGDRAAMNPGLCGCGRSLPLLSAVDGRSDEWFDLADGTRLHSQVACNALRHEEHVWQYQLRQPVRGSLQVWLVCAEACDRESLAQRVRMRLMELLGINANIDIQFVETIPPDPSGKRRAVVRSDRAEDGAGR